MPIERGRSPGGGVHPKHAYIDPKTGYRELDMEREVHPTTSEGGYTIIAIEGANDAKTHAVDWLLDAEGLDFLIDTLELAHREYDRTYRQLCYARDLAKEILYDRAAGS